jgi:23S rRNA pseudouridine1911/1915/1917 synthase
LDAAAIHNPPVRILYEDNHLIAVVKDAGVLTQRDRTGDESLMDVVKQWIALTCQKPGRVFLGLVHRLDRPVSGVVVFAKTSKGASRLSDQFRKRTVTKIYWAFVSGRISPMEGRLKHFLRKFRSTRKVRLYSNQVLHSRYAESEYRTLLVYPDFSLLEVIPATGRKHQIRSQLASIHHPILGDYKYGSSVDWIPKSIALHARSIRFEHPITKCLLTIEAPVPQSWKAHLQKR